MRSPGTTPDRTQPCAPLARLCPRIDDRSHGEKLQQCRKTLRVASNNSHM